MNEIVMVVHGGAGPDSDFIRRNQQAYIAALHEAVNIGYGILEASGSAIDAVEASVKYLEDNELFNAGRGSAISRAGGVEMCAALMNGTDLSSGAAAIVETVKNPVSLARAIMENSEHNYMGAAGAERFAREQGLEIRDADYFKTQHQLETFKQLNEERKQSPAPASSASRHGTVGAVCCDRQGNVAAATSTGGIDYKMMGRIADSSVVGAGVYANNNTCAISATGDGEYIIRHVVSHDVSAAMEYRNISLQQAAKYVLHEKLKDTRGDIGLIGVNAAGEACLEFNSERMHRAWKSSSGQGGAAIY